MRFRRILSIVLAATTISAAGMYGFRGAPFDRAAWLDDTQVRQGARLKMADRLVVRHSLHGKSRAEVLGLLGSPPKEAYFQEYDLVYWLGRERPPLLSFLFVGIDSEWLVVKFGASQRVSKVRILRD
jgi:hypothetical protein